MAQNLEIKARVPDWERTLQSARGLTGDPGVTFRQEDTFFVTPFGRLKLRCLDDTAWELIYYERLDAPGPKSSTFFKIPTSRPEGLADLLSQTFGVRGVVRKERTLLMYTNTRIHLDRVDGLGDFLELEIPMSPRTDRNAAQRQAFELMRSLQVEPGHLVEGAYLDLLERAHPTADRAAR